MTNVVVAMEAAGRTRQGIAPAQPCATRDSAQIKPTCVTGSLLFKTHCKPGAREVVTVRIRVGSGRAHRCIHRVPQAHELARIQFQSAHASRAVTAGVLSVISAPLRLFYSFRPLAGWSFHALLQFLQEPTSRVVKRFQNSTLSAGTTGLVAHSDGHRDSERKIGNVRKAGGEIRNVEC